MDLGRVFISSVFGGMLDLRDLAAEAARLVGLEPVLTEDHVAQAGTVRERLEKEIALCDTYVGLFDRRRGTVPDGTDSRAITEEEFRIAREKGLRRLVFLSEIDAADRDPDLKAFLDREVSNYNTGVWARYYKDETALAREIAAALSVLRPRVVVTLRPHGEKGLEAHLHLEGVQPAWKGPALVGPVEVDLSMSAGAEGVFRAFLEDANLRSQLKEESLRAAGGEMAYRALPGELGEALESVLDQAAHAGRLVTLGVRTEDGDALALPWELLSFPRHPLPVRQGLIEIVRHLPPPGQDSDPSHDPAPEIPADHIAVLGFTASPLEDEGVNVKLGAGGIGESSDLFWEREQERLLVALDDLVRTGRGRLILPDTGDKEELRQQLSRDDRPQIVHLSCHGGMAEGQPAVFLEDSEGHRAPVGADELLTWIRAIPGVPPLDLLVLSACDTAEARGLADRLVRNGLPRVLGMQSTVSDHGATAFAGAFYAALARGTDLTAAMRAGRAELFAQGGPHEWAIPTLTLSRDAGPLVAPRGSGAVPAPFEVVRKDFEIAGVTYLEKGYVGRREVERRLRRAFESERVMAIHGLGGIGKSTLASRFLERRREDGARVLVLYAGRELAAASLIEEVAKKVGVERSGSLPPEQAEQQFKTDLQAALRAVRPTLLFLDNFEDNQDEDGHLKTQALGEALADLVDLGGPGFRLLFTSRLPVDLPDLPFEVWNLDLGEFSPSGCRKLRLLDPEGLGSLEEPAWQQVMLHLGGHPKALELLGGYLKGRPDRVLTLLENFGEAVESVDRKLAAKRQERGRSLLVDTVLAEVPRERLPAFDRLCLLEEPLPSEELISLLTAEGIAQPASNLAWLRDHGLLARKVSPSALAGGDAVHRLLASRREKALAEREGEEAARAWHLRVAEHLVQPGKPLTNFGIAARHRDAAGDRAGALGVYDRWAMSLRDRHAYAACIQIAQEGLGRFPADDSEASRIGVAELWIRVSDGLAPLGLMADRAKVLETALTCLGGGDSKEWRFTRASINRRRGQDLVQKGDVHAAEKTLQEALSDFKKGNYEREAAITSGDIARLRSQAGDVAGALKLHEEMIRIFDQLGDVRSRAVTLGDIARLRSQAGDVAGALKLHEERIRIFDQLGDVRERAVTLGDIARLRSQAGDVEEARKLQEERLAVNRGLGDVDGIGAAQADLASLDFKEKKFVDARERLAEAWEIFNQIGRLDFLMQVGAMYGMILGATEKDRAIPILQTAKKAALTLGSDEDAEWIEGILKSLEMDGGEDAASPEGGESVKPGA
ncbi:MAG: CHAT domain-containing protein [Thermoanaerobaculia bacterium]